MIAKYLGRLVAILMIIVVSYTAIFWFIKAVLTAIKETILLFA